MPPARVACLFLTLSFAVSLVSTAFAAGDDDLPAPDAKAAGEITSLIKQLGDESFATREAATDKLLTYGLPALKLVEEGARDPDREIRYRCERVRIMLREIDLQRRLEAFAADVKGEKDHGLPAWDRFAELHGSGAASRQLFVDIFQAEPELLKTLQIDVKKASDVVTSRVFQLLQMQQSQQQLSLGNVAGMLFAAADKDIELSDQSKQYIYNFCYQQALRDAMTGDAAKQLPVRSLLGRYMTRSEGNLAYQALHVGMQFEMKESLDVARKIVKSRGAGNLHMLQVALPAMAKLGGVEDLADMEDLLDEKTVLFNFQTGANQPRIVCQVRDYALVSVLHLLAKDKEKLKGTPLENGDLKAFGFDRLEPNPTQLYNPQSIGFTNDEKREEVFKKWGELKEKLKDKLPAEKQPEEAKK